MSEKPHTNHCAGARRSRIELDVMRRIVADYIAEAMFDGPHEVALMFSKLAYSLESRRVAVTDAAKDAIKNLGGDPDEAWVDPAEPAKATPAQASAPSTDAVLAVVVHQLLKMSTNWESEVREFARAFTRELDEVGFDIDRRIEALADKTGHGPYLCDMFELRYDLTRQWSDCDGKRWEHTGSWSMGGPVMRRDEPDGDSMVLVDLIRKRGPLHQVVPAPRSPVVRKDELPPF